MKPVCGNTTNQVCPGVVVLPIAPKLIDVAKKHGVPRHVGRGLNIWGHVHITDVAELYLLALEKAQAGTLLYAENGEANFKSVTQSLGRMLGLGDRTLGCRKSTHQL